MKTPTHTAPPVALSRLVRPGVAWRKYQKYEWQWGHLILADKRQKVTVHCVVGDHAMVQSRKEIPLVCPISQLTQKSQNVDVDDRQ